MYSTWHSVPPLQPLLCHYEHWEPGEALLPGRGHRQRPHMASVRRTLPELQQGTVDDCSELHHHNSSLGYWGPLCLPVWSWYSFQNEHWSYAAKKHVVLSPSLFFLKQHASGLNLTCLSIIPTLPIGLTPGIGISFDYKHPTWTNWLLQFNENFIFIFISRFAWKCRILTCSLILCTWWLLQVPHPLYRPAQNRLIPCADSLCTALHSGLGSNKKCPSPKQCDYQIKYTDSASSQGVLINDNFSLPLKSSNIRPSLTFGYNTWVKYFLIV